MGSARDWALAAIAALAELVLAWLWDLLGALGARGDS
jgi:hypothetical protein